MTKKHGLNPCVPFFKVVERGELPVIFPKFLREAGSQVGEEHESFKGGILEVLRLPKELSFIMENSIGKMLVAQNDISVTIEISNLEVRASISETEVIRERREGDKSKRMALAFSLCYFIKQDNKPTKSGVIQRSVEAKDNPSYHEINIKNKKHIHTIDLPAGAELRLGFVFDNIDGRYTAKNFMRFNPEFLLMKTTTSVETFVDIENPAQNAKGITLFTALDKIAENYSDGVISLKSEILGKGGLWQNQIVATGLSYFGGGLSKKALGENIVVSSYKNNGNVIVEADSNVLPMQIIGRETLKDPISIAKLQQGNRVLFSGQKIEITLAYVSFEEFYQLYTRWRYGRDTLTGQEVPSRGYIDVKVGKEIISIYPLGSNAFEYQRKYRELTIKGRVKRVG